MMQATIDGISQDLSFSEGTYKNFLRLRLPDGALVRAEVDTDTAAKISALFVRMGGSAAERALSGSQQVEAAPAPPRPSSIEVQGDRAAVMVEDFSAETTFGGDFDGPPETTSNEWEARGPAAPALRVSSDSRGNPVVQGTNVVDTAQLVGGAHADEEEDGIGSV